MGGFGLGLGKSFLGVGVRKRKLNANCYKLFPYNSLNPFISSSFSQVSSSILSTTPNPISQEHFQSNPPTAFV